MSKIVELPHKVTLYLPSQYGKSVGGGVIPKRLRREFQRQVIEELFRVGVDGCTVTRGHGHWSDGTSVVSERVDLLSFHVSEEMYKRDIPSIGRLIHSLYEQDAYAVEYDGVLSIIPADQIS